METSMENPNIAIQRVFSSNVCSKAASLGDIDIVIYMHMVTWSPKMLALGFRSAHLGKSLW